MINMSKNGDNGKKNILENKELSIELKGKSKKFQISVKTNLTISELPEAIDEITSKIIQSKSFSQDNILDFETIGSDQISPPPPTSPP